MITLESKYEAANDYTPYGAATIIIGALDAMSFNRIQIRYFDAKDAANLTAYRNGLVELEKNLCQALENVRILVGNLPATSVESAYPTPLFNSFPEEDATAAMREAV